MDVDLEANINLHEEGDMCVQLFEYTYTRRTRMRKQTEEQDRHIGKAMCTAIGTVT